MRSLSALIQLAFDAGLLAAAPGALTHLTFLLLQAAHVSCTSHYPISLACPLAPHDVPPATAPHLAVLDRSSGLAATLAHLHLLRCMTLCIASTLYDGLHPVALFSALAGSLKELVLVLTPDMGVHTCGRLVGTVGNTGAGLEVLEPSLNRTSDEVSLQALGHGRTHARCKQVESPLPDVQARFVRSASGL
ncbi:hypothetical protein EDB87DRAFT_1662441, partial [Lactarius vividus]